MEHVLIATLLTLLVLVFAASFVKNKKRRVEASFCRLSSGLRREVNYQNYLYMIENENKLKRGAILYGLDNTQDIDPIKLICMLEKVEKILEDPDNGYYLEEFYETNFKDKTESILSWKKKAKMSFSSKKQIVVKFTSLVTQRLKSSNLISAVISIIRDAFQSINKMGVVGDEEEHVFR